MSALYNLTVKTIKNQDWELSSLKGKVVLFVNVASKCGYAKQYSGLESLYNKYKDQGFEMIGVPCNQFLNQEPGTNEEILELCQRKYDVNFPLLEKMDVNGDNTAPLYQFLKDSKSGILGLSVVKWNFEKFLVDKSGNVVKRFATITEPESIAPDIEELLKQE
ncbi:thioredoxin-like protein [Sporodiniella umbellata]|nr:thioredoxin-like protein [Sporodiniella umbellata]